MKLIFSAAVATLLAVTPALADECGLTAQLKADGKELPRMVGVPRRDREMVQSHGVELRNGLFGGTNARSQDLIAAAERAGCPAELMAWLERKGRSAGGADGGDSGGAGRGGSGLTQ